MPRKRVRGNQYITGDLTVAGALAVSGAITPSLGLEYNDSTFLIKNTAAPTQIVRFSAAGVTAGQTRVLTSPDYNGTLATLAGTEALTNKTLTSPKVGTAMCDTGGNEIIKTPATASAVNEFTITNAATGTQPILSATGGDANISIVLTAKGTGKLVASNRIIDLRTAATIADAQAMSYTAAQVLGGIILRDPNGGARQDTLPTAAALVAAIPGCAVGSSFEFTLRNTADAGETITVVGPDAAVTVSGTATVAQSNSKRWLAVISNIGSGTEAYTVYSLGTVVF